VFVGHGQRFDAVGGARDHAQFGPHGFQLAFQVFTQMGFVVCNQGADGIDVWLAFKGSMRRTVMPQG
jgi:hypothetical protein